MAIKFHNPKTVALAGKYSLGAEVPANALALMHGPVYVGDGPAALRALADVYEDRLAHALGARVG